MKRPLLLDLFCGAGGCTKGYQRAGFYVVGVDAAPQPNYCGDEFFQYDAMAFDLSGFDAIHASPPCQGYSRAMKHLSHPTELLLEATRDRLRAQPAPWVIENVEGAPIPKESDLFGNHGIMLCGSSFGLRVWRHRLFLSSLGLTAPKCNHGNRHAMNPHNVDGRKRMYAEFGRGDPEKVWRVAMGVEWMGRYEAREAIPPAYTEHIGRQLLAHIEQEKAA